MYSLTKLTARTSFFSLAILACGLLACQQTNDEPIVINPEFTGYISGFTSGVISNSSTIRIQLMDPVEKSVRESLTGLFSFKPGIEGEVKWIDHRTIQFRPSELLPSGKTINAKFDLGAVTEVPDHLKEFEFQIRTREQHVRMAVNGLRNYNASEMEFLQLTGSFSLADHAEKDLVEGLLVATIGGSRLPVSWTHGVGTSSTFVVDSVKRADRSRQLVLSWDGDVLDVDQNGEREIRIPSLDEFSVLNVTSRQEPEQSITVSFSDPLDGLQELDGLITLGNGVGLRSVVDLNEITLYPKRRLSGKIQFDVLAGVKNMLGFKTDESFTTTLSFENLKPAVRLIGKGVIIPGTESTLFPFEAVNLNSVRVRVIKIFEDNVAQFLQVNQMDGDNELRRVGRPVLNKEIALTLDPKHDRASWNPFSIDLAELVATEPGAVYRVELSFDRSHSNFPCDDDGEEFDEETDAGDEGYWDEPGRYYYHYRRYNPHFKWRERDDPCKPSYFLDHKKTVSRNVLASDLGVMAKSGDDGKINVFVTDLLSTETLKDVVIEAFNYQHDRLGLARTNSEGMAELTLNGKPYLIVAKYHEKVGYLRVDAGSSLNMSMFQVAGKAEKKGVNGMIYGERGVWRPGDSLFLSFMLYDKEKVLPKKHPVVFQLTDPRGRKRDRIVRTESVNGLFDFRTATTTEDPTGNWTATVSVGGSTFTKNIKIETVKPNRLKLALDFPQEVLLRGKDQTTGLAVKWLHGAPANGLKADVSMKLRAVSVPNKKFEGFHFTDVTSGFDGSERTVFEGTLDQDGNATFDPEIKVWTQAPGMLKATFMCRGFEHGGDISTDQFSTLYSPYDSYVGMKIPEGKGWRGGLNSELEHGIKLAVVDPEGEPTSGKVVVEVFRIGWRWWWEGNDRENLARYVRNRSANELNSDTVNLSNGKAVYKMKLSERYWGRALVVARDLESGHTSSKVIYMNYPGWRQSMADNGSMGATMLSFETDKEDYLVGESVDLNVPSSTGGKLLVSIENGSKVLKKFWVKAKEGQTNISIPLTKEMAPNVYAHVTLVQPHDQTKNDLPIRLYGVQPILVTDPTTKLEPEIEMVDEIRPESNYEVKVSEATGKPMTYTLAVVDEGLLDLTRFQTPDPWKHFNQKVALGVKTWDMYDLVLGAQSGEMAGLLALGGDGFNRKKGDQRANRFKPVVSFVGPFELAAGQTASHELAMSNYVGSVRVMVVAGQDGSFGNAEKTVPVKKPLMVLTSLPRVLGPGESVKLPVTVFAMDKSVKDVDVKVKVNGVVQIEGKSNKRIRFDRIGDQVVEFDLVIPETIGIAKVDVEVTSGNEKASHQTELDVRIGNPPVKDVVKGLVEPGQEIEIAYSPVGMEGTNTATLELSTMPPLNLEERLRYLIRYPHGCIEQTTSSVFPQLALNGLMDLDSKRQAQIQENINAGIQRLMMFQMSSGGFTYWPNGSEEASEWGSNYAGHFLVEASKRGYHVPKGMLDDWADYQRSQARSWNANGEGTRLHYYNSNHLTQAYRLYTLALAGKPDVGSMNRLREVKDLRNAAKWRLAAAYALIGRNSVAKDMVEGLNMDVEPYRELSGSYGSTTRDQAMILETMNKLEMKKDGFEMMELLAKKLGASGWYSTQTTAYVLIAISDYVGGDQQDRDINLRYALQDGSKGRVESKKPVAQVKIDKLANDAGVVKLTNNGTTPVFARVLQQGIPSKDDRKSENNNLSMRVYYTDMQGKKLDPTKLVQGTDFVATVVIRHPGVKNSYDEMALSQVFPSGWEIINNRILGEENAFEGGTTPEFQDIRDDRVYTYFDLRYNDVHTYKVQLNAAYAGRFHLPTVYAEAMYDNDINSRVAGTWVEVHSSVGGAQVSD